MQSDRITLFQSIFEHPDDDTIRLVYADWLEEHGDQSDIARAKYIRMAVEKNRLPRHHPKRNELLDGMRALLKEHRSQWFPDSPLIHDSPWKARHRGFLRHIRGSAAQFNEHAATLFAAEPVTDLYLEPGQAGFDEFAASPFLSRLRAVTFPEGSLPPFGLARLADRLTSLRKLELDEWRANAFDLEAFVRAPWPHLESLTFHRCGLDDDSLRLLARMNAPRMKCLQLASESVGARGIDHLLSAPWLRQIARLDLVQMGQPLPLETLEGLAHAAQLRNLRSLDLSHNPVGAEGINELANSFSFGQVRTLNLSYTRGGAHGLIALFNSPTLRQVKDLMYESNDLDFRAAEEKMSSWPQLRRLSITLTDHGLCWLLDRSLLNSVRHLWIFMAGLTGAGFLALVRSPLPQSLVSLNLASNNLGTLDGLPTLLHLPQLRELQLDDCHLGDDGAVRLLKALRRPRLRELSLCQNGLTNETVQALASNPTLRSLEVLEMADHIGIDDEGARLLCEAPHLGRLKTLVLQPGISEEWLGKLRQRIRHVR